MKNKKKKKKNGKWEWKIKINEDKLPRKLPNVLLKCKCSGVENKKSCKASYWLLIGILVFVVSSILMKNIIS